MTGGNGGIGRGIALGLAEAGAAVAVLGRTDGKNQRVLSELKATGVPSIAVRVDVTDRASLEPRNYKTRIPTLWLPILVFWATAASQAQVIPSTAEIESPDLNLIVQRLEDIQQQDPGQSRKYEVTREYKVFHGSDKRPTSEVTAQINFVPPDVKTYKINRASGNSRGEKMVRELLDRETESTKKGHSSEISRMNYDFVFLRRENFGIVPEYVLLIVPKRKDNTLLRGQIWVDASTFRIRRIEGVPAKSPSFWLKNIHITLQFAQLGGMWVPVSFDAIATVRFFGQYTLAGLNIRSSESIPIAPK